MPLTRLLTSASNKVAAAGILALGTLFGSAHAVTNCSASMTNVSFGSSDPFTGWSDVTATISYSCQTTGLSLLSSAAVRLCFSIFDGDSGTGSFFPRRMVSGGGDSLFFNLYRDASYSQIWGTFASGQHVERVLQYSVPLLGGSGGGFLTVYGRIPSNQNTAIPGSYLNYFSSDAIVLFQANEVLLGSASVPNSCLSGGVSSGLVPFPFFATAVVDAACNPTFAVQDMDFGTQGLLDTPVDVTATISPQCTNTTVYQIGLDDGLHASGGQRRMRNPLTGRHVAYDLYQDVGRSLRWGNTVGVDTVATTGTGNAQPRAIYGRVDAQATPPSGSYSDTITVTITY